MGDKPDQPTSEKPAAAGGESAGGATSPTVTAEPASPEVADGRQQGSPSDEDWKQKYLQAKEAEERANRLERELAETRAKLGGSQPPTPTAADPLTAMIQQREAQLRPIYERAAMGDPDATEIWNNWVTQRDYMRHDQMQKAALAELMQVPEAERPKVTQLMAEGKFRSAKDALEHVRATERASKLSERETELEKLKRENEQLKADAERRARGAISTGRGVPLRSEGGKDSPKSVSEAVELLDRYEREGNEAARYELSRRMRRGDLKDLPPT